jgi:Domain of unknown function (DUF4265)
MEKPFVKLRFQLDPSDWHGHGSETLWAEPIAETEFATLRIANSPYFTTGISHCDVVRAKAAANGLLFDFLDVIERGGHSTYMILAIPEDATLESYWTPLQDKGCSYESMTINLSVGRRLLYSVDVPPSANVYEVYSLLEEGESDGVWKFQEGFAYPPSSKA